MQNPIGTTTKLAINIVRSVLFLASFVSSIIFLQCYANKTLPLLSKNQIGVVASIVSGFGIVFEQAHRRAELTYYCMPRCLDTIWNWLEKRQIVKTIKY